MKNISKLFFLLVCLSSFSFSAFAVDSISGYAGTFFASLSAFKSPNGATHHTFVISYKENPKAGIVVCRSNVSFVFIVGADNGGHRESIKVRGDKFCPGDFGDNPGSVNSVSWRVDELENPELWNKLFPLRKDGTRWYAVQVAVTNNYNQWDSDFGNNYRIILNKK